ncbi:MAG: L,D-transpeptidase family protein [Pseudolabrys sp.]
MRKLALIAMGTLLSLPVAAQAELVVNISKKQQELSVVVNGETAYRWPVSTGRPRYPTPVGKFRPIRLEKDWYSRKYNRTPMPWSVFFYRGYAIHGTLDTRKLGRAVSHGCVRLLPSNAAILFAMVRSHGMNKTQFVVTNGALPNTHVPPPPAPKRPQDVPAAVAQGPADVPLPLVRVARHAAPQPDAPVTAIDVLPVAAPESIRDSEPAPPAQPEPAVQLAIRHDAAREAHDGDDAAEPRASASDEPAIGMPIAAAPVEAVVEPEAPPAAAVLEPDPVPLPAARPAPVTRAAVHVAKETHEPAPKRVGPARADYSVSVGSEAQVLREREAWLRSLDRRFGIAR